MLGESYQNASEYMDAYRAKKVAPRDLGKILCIQEFQTRILVTMEYGLCELKGDELVELKIKAES